MPYIYDYHEIIKRPQLNTVVFVLSQAFIEHCAFTSDLYYILLMFYHIIKRNYLEDMVQKHLERVNIDAQKRRWQ